MFVIMCINMTVLVINSTIIPSLDLVLPQTLKQDSISSLVFTCAERL